MHYKNMDVCFYLLLVKKNPRKDNINLYRNVLTYVGFSFFLCANKNATKNIKSPDFLGREIHVEAVPGIKC